MPRKSCKPKSPAHRPKIPIDWEEAAKALKMGANGVQVAAQFGCAPNTLYDRCYEEQGVTFSEFSAKNRACGDLSLHARQYQEALKGNTTMLIWLGKNRLGQKENPEPKRDELERLGAILKRLMELSPNELPGVVNEEETEEGDYEHPIGL